MVMRRGVYVLAAFLTISHVAALHSHASTRSSGATARAGNIVGGRSLLPATVEALLPSAALKDQAAVVPLWRSIRRCYPTDDAAVEALRRNRGLLLPWVSSASSIESNYKVTLASRLVDVVTWRR